MVRVSLMLVIFIFFGGCSSKAQKELMADYEKNLKYSKHLQKTEKVQLYDGDITKALLTATYLYDRDKSEDDEKFIIGVHLSDEYDDNNLTNSGYLITLNGKKAKSVEELDRDDKRLKDISFVTEWGVYYFVKFPHISSKRFKIEFESELYGKGKLEFAKVAKYIFTKESI